jgi:ABC-type polysaccharide/polyol phosphate transport system ATPase subunit
MSGAVIQVEDVGKRYAIGERGYRTLRESLSSVVRRGAGDGKPEALWALRDVSFEVERGEVVGIVGLNGAGKTTLLKILSRITFPTTGVSRTRGRVGALLEVGTGFHPELTGRENVFLNAAVLGMTRQETRARLDDIVEFAGLEEFLDTPLKRYSTGMYLRLAFAVAAHVEPDIVIVDEVLAVGDFQFREKCLGRMSDLGREGRTVIFVSHDSGVVHQLCSRALWIDDGTLREDGPTAQVLDGYLRSSVQGGALATFVPSASKPVSLRSVAIVGAAGEVLESPRRGEPFSLRVRFATERPVLGLDIAVSIQTVSGVPVLDEVLSDTAAIGEPAKAAGEWEAVFAVPPVLSPGSYLAGVWLGTGAESFFTIREALSFQILPGLDDRPHAAERQRVLTAPHGWHVTSAPADDRP